MVLSFLLPESKDFDLDCSLVLPGHLKSGAAVCVLFLEARELLLLPDIGIYLSYRCYSTPGLKEHCAQVMGETSGVSF